MTIKLRLRPWDLWIAEQFPRADRTRVWAEMVIADALHWSAFWLAYGFKMSAVVSFALAAWRFGVDINVTRNFLIADGLWSHWQVWLALSIAAALLAMHLRAWSERPVRAANETASYPWRNDAAESDMVRALAD